MSPDTPIPRRTFLRVVRLLGVVTLAAFALAAYTFVSAHSQAVDRTARLCGVIRDVLVDARNQVAELPRGKERANALAFYNRHIAALNSLPCDHHITKGTP